MYTRATPNMITVRPADGNETSGAYAVAIENRKRPTVIVLTRQGVQNLKGTSIEGVYKGGYIIHEPAGKPDIILVGTGSETALCVAAVDLLKDLKVSIKSLSIGKSVKCSNCMFFWIGNYYFACWIHSFMIIHFTK